MEFQFLKFQNLRDGINCLEGIFELTEIVLGGGRKAKRKSAHPVEVSCLLFSCSLFQTNFGMFYIILIIICFNLSKTMF